MSTRKPETCIKKTTPEIREKVHKNALKNAFGVRAKNKLTAIFAEIDGHEKTAAKIVKQTAKAYYNAGNILADVIRNIPFNVKGLTAKAIADASGFSERRITTALKIFKHFENNPDALNGLTLRDSLKLIAPPPAAGEEVHKCGRNGIKHHGIYYYHPALLQYSGQDVVIRNKIITDNEMPVYAIDGTFICNAIGDYFAEGQNLGQAIKRVESVRKHTLLSLAERGTNEVAIAAEQRIMLETAMNIYNDNLPSLESLLGEEEQASQDAALPMAAGAEYLPAKKNKYVSVLDARPEHILHMEVSK